MLRQLRKCIPQNKVFLSLGLLGAVSFVFLASPALAQGFQNPLDVDDVTALLSRVARFLLGLVGFLALLALVWGGILYIVALGQDQYIQQAKKIILWAIIGLTISLLSFTIMSLVQNVIEGRGP